MGDNYHDYFISHGMCVLLSRFENKKLNSQIDITGTGAIRDFWHVADLFIVFTYYSRK